MKPQRHGPARSCRNGYYPSIKPSRLNKDDNLYGFNGGDIRDGSPSSSYSNREYESLAGSPSSSYMNEASPQAKISPLSTHGRSDATRPVNLASVLSMEGSNDETLPSIPNQASVRITPLNPHKLMMSMDDWGHLAPTPADEEAPGRGGRTVFDMQGSCGDERWRIAGVPGAYDVDCLDGQARLESQ
jgi:hypothetical protein